jgi:hypothetical protein
MNKDVEERFNQIDKRIGDIKTFVTATSSILIAVFVTLGIFAGINLLVERNRIKELAQDLREKVDIALGQAAQRPEVIILKSMDTKLSDQVLSAKLEKREEGGKNLVIKTILKNKGNKATGPLFLKIYSSDPIRFSRSSTDEKDFAYESFISPENIEGKILPAGVSLLYTWRFTVQDDLETIQGDFPILLKIYYGGDNPSQTRFRITFE